MNLVLSDTEEFRRTKRKTSKAPNAPLTEVEEKRTLGLIILRGVTVISLSVEGPPSDTPASRLPVGGGAPIAPIAPGPGMARPAGRGLPIGLGGPPGGFAPGGGPPGFAGLSGPMRTNLPPGMPGVPGGPPTGFQPPQGFGAPGGGPPGGPPGFGGPPGMGRGFPPGGAPPGFR